MAVLLIGASERVMLQKLARLAEENPVDITTLMAKLATPEGKAKHMQQMTLQSRTLPVGYWITYSIEDGHPIGRARHLSVTVDRPGKAPSVESVWMIAKELGFYGESIQSCDRAWVEDLVQGKAVNVAQAFTPPTQH